MQSVTKSFNLRENLKLRLLKDMLSKLKEDFRNVANFIMVVDPFTTRILSSCLKMAELLEENVVAIEKIDLVRKAFPKMHAIYFITPSEDSVDRLIDDFSSSTPQYGNVHIFFSNKLDDTLFEKIKMKKPLLEKILTFKQINIDFLCPESNIFHFDMPQALATIFSRKGTSHYNKMLEEIALKLASVVPTFFDYEKFQIIYNKNPINNIAEKVAKQLRERIEKFVEIRNKDDDAGVPAAPIKIVILDRSFDPVTPVIHDFHYISMVYDLLEVNQDVVEYESEEKSGKSIIKKAVLNENDKVWTAFRFKFIADAMEQLPEQLQTFTQNDKAALLQKGIISELNIREAGDIVKGMPMFYEIVDKYTLHISLVDKCNTVFRQKSLKDLGEYEYKLLTGLDQDSKTADKTKLAAALHQKANDGKFEAEDRFRLAMIACMCADLSEKDRKAITVQLLEAQKSTIQKLSHLGVIVDGPSKLDPDDEKRKVMAAKLKLSKPNAFPLERYTTPIEELAYDVINNKQEAVDYGTLSIPSNYDGSMGNNRPGKVGTGPISLRKGTVKANLNWQDSGDEKTQPKIVFFVIGGLSYCEIRALHEVQGQNPNVCIVMGSTSLVTPKQYIQGISDMGSAKEFSL